MKVWIARGNDSLTVSVYRRKPEWDNWGFGCCGVEGHAVRQLADRRGQNMSFVNELESLINRHSMENGSDTPDYILAAYLKRCLDAFDDAVRARTFHARKGELEDTHDPDTGKRRRRR